MREGRRTAEEFLDNADQECQIAVTRDDGANGVAHKIASLLPDLPSDLAVLLARGVIRHAATLRVTHPEDALALIEVVMPTIQALAPVIPRAKGQLQLGIALARLGQIERAMDAFDSVPDEPTDGTASDADELAVIQIVAFREKADLFERLERFSEAADCLSRALLSRLDLEERDNAQAFRGWLVDDVWRGIRSLG